MEYVKLKDLCEKEERFVAPREDAYIDYVDISSVDNKSKTLTKYDTYIFAEAPSRARKKVMLGDVIVSTVRPNLNAVAIFNLQTTYTPIVSTGFCVLRNKSDVDPSYIYFFCTSSNFVRQMVSKATGASYPAVSDTIVREAKLPKHTAEQRARIVTTLLKTKKIIECRRAQLTKLDEIVKCRFVELFGDPTLNPFNWEIVPLSSIIRGNASNGYFAKREEYSQLGNVQVLGVANVVNRMYSSTYNLPRTNAKDTDIKKYLIKYGDMLFCRSSLVAEGIGKASIVPPTVPKNTLFECHVIRISLDLSQCVPEYIQVLSTDFYFRNQVIAQSKTATMTTISQDGILKCCVPLPPLELQKEFLTFTQRIDKLRFFVWLV